MNLILNGIDMGKIKDYCEFPTNRHYDMAGGFSIVFQKHSIEKDELRYDDEFVWLKKEGEE